MTEGRSIDVEMEEVTLVNFGSSGLEGDWED
jgi:hypothetical protein